MESQNNASRHGQERCLAAGPFGPSEGLPIKIMLLAEFMDEEPDGLTATKLLLSAAEGAKRLTAHLAG